VKPRIVIVDDNFDLRQVLREFLVTQGYEVEAYPLAIEAIRRYGERRFDIALVDLALPDVDGLQVVGRLRGLSTDVGIIAFSGLNRLREAALDAGCDRFVLKPSVEDLLKALHEWPWRRARRRAASRRR
jgi:two-component system, OmpR family, KDP operon response regulator KdpE